jgi:hypothetical protein
MSQVQHELPAIPSGALWGVLVAAKLRVANPLLFDEIEVAAAEGTLQSIRDGKWGFSSTIRDGHIVERKPS